MSRLKGLGIAQMAMMLSGGMMPKVKAPVVKNFKKPLSAYHVPPRSATPEEKAYYDKHKSMAGFYKK